MQLSSFGQQLVSGQAEAWAKLLDQPVLHVTRARAAYTGSSSRLRRLDLTLGSGERRAVLIKFTDAYEVRVYRDLAPGLPLDLPRAYYTQESNREGLCLLEALPGGKSIAQWSSDDERAALGDLARLHAAFGPSSRLDSFPWLYNFETELNAQLDKAQKGVRLLKQIGGWPGLITPDVLRVMETLLADRARLLAPLAGLPPTLIHGDAWQPNWVLTKNRRVLLDWQSAARGPGVWDMVYFLEMSGEAGGKLPLEESEALETYLDALEGECAEAASHRKTFVAAVPAVSVINTLARWPAYADDYMRPVERLPFLARVWKSLPTGLRQRIEAWAAWTGVEYYRERFARFQERARIVYGA